MQREDVYETKDLPESEQCQSVEENFDSEHIEKVKLKVGDAYQSFKGKSLHTDGADFSDSIAKRRKGYGADSFFVELVRPVGGEPETVIQQYNRLQSEIAELSGKLEEIKINDKASNEAEKKVDAVTAKDLADLQRHLKQLQMEQILGVQATESLALSQSSMLKQVLDSIEKAKQPKQKEKPKNGPITYELYCSTVVDSSRTDSGLDSNKLPALESRLASIEKFLGSESDKISSLMAETKAKNIMELAENLQQRITMLDNTQLDLVDARMSILLHKLSQIKDKKSGLDAEQNGKISELYEMMRKWDALCCSLPQIVCRLQSLKELHEQALQFSQCLTYLDGVQQELNKTLDSDASLLNEVKETFAKNIDAFKNNCETVEKRLKALSVSK